MLLTLAWVSLNQRKCGDPERGILFHLTDTGQMILGICSRASARSASIMNDSLNNGGLIANPFYPSIASCLRGLIKYHMPLLGGHWAQC
jgi:hypothetical protein